MLKKSLCSEIKSREYAVPLTGNIFNRFVVHEGRSVRFVVSDGETQLDHEPVIMGPIKIRLVYSLRALTANHHISSIARGTFALKKLRDDPMRIRSRPARSLQRVCIRLGINSCLPSVVQYTSAGECAALWVCNTVLGFTVRAQTSCGSPTKEKKNALFVVIYRRQIKVLALFGDTIGFIPFTWILNNINITDTRAPTQYKQRLQA